MSTPYTHRPGAVRIGSKHTPPKYPAYTSADEDKLQQALRDHHKERVCVGKRSLLWHLMRWLRSPRAW